MSEGEGHHTFLVLVFERNKVKARFTDVDSAHSLQSTILTSVCVCVCVYVRVYCVLVLMEPLPLPQTATSVGCRPASASPDSCWVAVEPPVRVCSSTTRCLLRQHRGRRREGLTRSKPCPATAG